MHYFKIFALAFSGAYVANCSYAIDYSMGLSYETNVMLDGNSNNATSEGQIELKEPQRVIQLPQITLYARQLIAKSNTTEFHLKASIAYQYGSIRAPSGFYIKNGNFKIDFIEPSSATSQTYKGELSFESSKKLGDAFRFFSGVGLLYAEEKIEYILGDWHLSEGTTRFRSKIYTGFDYQYVSNRNLPELSCHISYDDEKHTRLQCGAKIKLS